MAKDSDHSFNKKSFTSQESDSNKSFVKKVTSRVSGFIPSSISKWFGNAEHYVRRRDEVEDDEEYFDIQPPSKRIKPSEADTSLHSFQTNSTSTTMHTSNTANNFNAVNNHVEKKGDSIFPEPIAGPSGIQSRKTFTPAKCSTYKRASVAIQQEVLNGDKHSDSDESTSGYSSMLKIGTSESKISHSSSNPNSSKCNNTSLGVADRSLFSERSLSPQVNISLSSRQPSFNASVFGSPSFVDRTISSKRIMNSPFYNGRTIYGGASAYGCLGRPPPDSRSSIRNTVQIKPVNEKQSNNNAVLSKTARRILDTLEQYTAPIADARKIPNPSIRTSKHISSSPYTVRERKVASNKELQVPTVPDLLKMKLKERLQDSTVSVRQMAITSKSALNTEEYKIRTDDDDNIKHTNKIKAKVSSVRQKPVSNETMPEVKLPDVQLPISTLPKFDFSLPAPRSLKSSTMFVDTKSEIISTSISTLKNIKKSSTTMFQNKVETKTSTKEIPSKTETCKMESNKTENYLKESCSTETTEYKFANPVILADNLKSINAINNFIFSEPLAKKQVKSAIKTDMASNFKYSDIKNELLKKAAPEVNDTSSIKDLLNTGTTGTVSDVLNKDVPISLMAKFKPSSDTWECSVCLIRNLVSRTRCEACDTLKTNSNKSLKSVEVGDKFKITSGQSMCKTCRIVLNSPDKLKCGICECSELESSLPKVEGNNEFGDKFKLSSDKWECSSCLVRNNNTDSNCVACTTPRATTNGTTSFSNSSATFASFGDKFKPATNSWECSMCMIRNRNELAICAACESLKPESVSVTKRSDFGGNFKKKEDEWECDSCMVRNKSDKLKCQCCESRKPGLQQSINIPKEKSTLSTFNFGIDKSSTTNIHGFSVIPTSIENQNASVQSISSIFGHTVTNTTNVVPTTFVFGIKPVQNNVSTGNVKKSTEPSDIVSIVSASTTLPVSSSLNNDKPSQVNPVTTGFVFGSDASTPVKNISTSDAFAQKSSLPVVTQRAIEEIDSTVSKKTNTVGLTNPFTLQNTHSLPNKPVSLNGDINSGSVFKNASNSAQLTPAVTDVITTDTGKNTPVTSNSGNLFSFGAKPQPTSSSLFSANTNKQSSFKFSPTEAKPITSDKPAFGTSNINTSASTFGNPTTSVFGSSGVPAFEAPLAPTFGTQPVAETKSFQFTSTNAGETAPKVAAFSFGQNSAKPVDTKKTNLFNFGSSSTANLSSNVFSTASNSTNQPSGCFNFNSPPFGSLPQLAQNGAFNFGSNVNNTPKTGFNFGATQPVAGANTQGVFNFGAPANNTPGSGSGGFSFGSSEVKPNFNFTAGSPPPAFNAQPSTDKPRVIRKAVRRTQR